MVETNVRIKVKPFLKWAGGKNQLIQRLTGFVPYDYGKYIEPMVGGGALFFHVQPKKAILADLNQELINCYLVVRDDTQNLINRLILFSNDKETYYKVRNQNPMEMDPVSRAARTIFLNKTCYNGLYRVNKKGEFNVPFGYRKNPSIVDEENLWAASQVLQGTEVIFSDYKSILQDYAKPRDFVYLDPPYYPAGEYSDFKRYTKEFFYENDHIELKYQFKKLAELGCWALLTNSNTEFVRRLYSEFEYEIVETKRNISSDSKTRVGQDIIVMVKPNVEETGSRSKIQGNKFLGKFPGTRFMGSKYKVLPFILNCIKDIDFETVIDAFAGSGCVSYMLKQSGKRVISNDFMSFSYYLSKALIENSKVRLDNNDVEMLMASNAKANSFISRIFSGLYFTDDENRFLDSLIENVELLDNEYKKSLALAAISRACIKKRPRGIFTFTGNRYDDGRRDLTINLQQHFLENVKAFNAAVFDNGKNNLALNSDVYALNVKADLVYIDPPYVTPNSDNDYTRRYHFVEGLVKRWKGLELQENTKTKKFKRYETPFSHRDTIYVAFDKLFDKFRESILVVSYSSNSIPDKAELMEMIKKYKHRVKVHQMDYVYSFGNQGNKVGNNANRAKEFIFIGY